VSEERDWREPYDHSMAILAVAAKDPALAMILNHQHDCIEMLKFNLGNLPTDMRKIVHAELRAVTDEREQTTGARWLWARGWLTTLAAITAGAASVYSAVAHH
jgi:hypothetical protein